MTVSYRQFEKLGFTRAQYKTYITLLRLGGATIPEIAKTSGIPRTTTYDTVAKLLELDLISEFYKNGRPYYAAKDPDKLKEVPSLMLSEIDLMLPELHNMYSTKKAQVQFLSGTKGAKEIHELSLKYHKENLTRCIGGENSLFSLLSEKYIKNYFRRRVEKGIRNYVITTEDVLEKKHLYSSKKNKEALREIRYIPGSLQMETALFSFDNFVCILPSKQEQYSIIIESQEFRGTFDILFNTLWKAAKKVE